jgi:hypothetical protein
MLHVFSVPARLDMSCLLHCEQPFYNGWKRGRRGNTFPSVQLLSCLCCAASACSRLTLCPACFHLTQKHSSVTPCLLAGVPTGITFSGASVGVNAVRVAAMQAPGLSASNIWLLPDPTAASAMPEGHSWPAALTAAHTAGSGSGGSSSSSSGAVGTGISAAARVAIGTSVGLVVALALLLAAVWYWCTRRRRQQRRMQQQQQQQQPGKVYELAVPPGRSEGPLGADPTGCSLHQKQPQAAAGVAGVVAGSDASFEFDQTAAQEHKQHRQICAKQLPANSHECARAGRPRTNSDSDRAAASSGSQGWLATSAESYNVSNNLHGNDSLGYAGGSTQSESVDATGDSVSTGLERWKAAIRLTTMQMMERKMQQLHTSPYSSASGSGSQQSPTLAAAALAAPGAAAAARRVSKGQSPGGAAAAGRAAGPGAGSRSSNSSGAESAAVPVQQPLRLQTLIGQGSFGSVYLGTW